MAHRTLDHELFRYEIGGKLKALRLKKKLGLVDLGRHSGLSPALLSKLERGKMTIGRISGLPVNGRPVLRPCSQTQSRLGQPTMGAMPV